MSYERSFEILHFLIHLIHTGLPTSILFPVSLNNPVWRLTLKTTISLLFWLATSRKFPPGSKLKLRGVLPNTDCWPTNASVPDEGLILKIEMMFAESLVEAYKNLPSLETCTSALVKYWWKGFKKTLMVCVAFNFPAPYYLLAKYIVTFGCEMSQWQRRFPLTA